MKRNATAVLTGLSLLFLLGCEGASGIVDPGTEAPPPLRTLQIAPGDLAPTGFQFLPPIASQPEAMGPANPDASPVVQICASSACDVIHAHFTTTEGSGAQTVRFAEGAGSFIVNWNPRSTGASPGGVYRVRVMDGGSMLGSVEVHVVSTGREAVAIRSDGSVAVLVDQTLPIRFHVGVGPPPAERWLNGTGDPGELDFVSLQFPSSLSVREGEAVPPIFGRVFHAGITDAQMTPSARIRAEVGYGTAGSDPRSDPSWQWFPAAFSLVVGNDHEYTGTFPAPSPGTYSFTYRFELDGEGFTLADLGGAGSVFGGFSFDPDQLGAMTVSP